MSSKKKSKQNEDISADNLSDADEILTADSPQNTAENPTSENVKSDAGKHATEADKATPEQQYSDENEAEIDEIAALKQEIAHLNDTLLRRMAEFDNVKKRMLRERMILLEDAKFEALKSFLPINDDLQRTLKASDGQEIPVSFLQGVQLVAEKFEKVLESNGVVEINEENVPFDVNLHDALMRRPADDPKTPSDTVLQVLEPGYKAGEKVIRHAKVIVSE